ncbi:MAG: SNF2-related protein [Paludibacter sp.]|nr:SNF2-related protein [Paludibacter sp.]
MVRTYGNIYLQDGLWHIKKAEPHICIKLKAIFPRYPKSATDFKFIDSPEVCHDLLWFMDRYPLSISDKDLKILTRQKKNHIADINELESILLPEYTPVPVHLKNGYTGRDYQIKGMEVYLKKKRILIGDDIGIGKTLIGILSMLHPETLPCICVLQTHLPGQWKSEIEKFTNLRVHLVKGTSPYNLPEADVYITKYSCLSGWTSVYAKRIFKSAIFDECQELRRCESNRYAAARVLSRNVNFCLGLSASPIYNYGNEIFNVIDALNEGSLGDKNEFLNEWIRWGDKKVQNPQALGTYLRENFLMLRRTRQEVGRELPPVNKIIHTVEYDADTVKEADEIATMLAIKVTSGTFVERGAAARDLDIFVRQQTGIAKARGVAEYCKILLENNEPIVLAAWHRECFAKGTQVIMFDGSLKNIEDVKVGDTLIGPDSQARNVLSLINGAGQLFKIIPTKGNPFICSENHILTLYKDGKYIKNTVSEYIKLSPRQQQKRLLYRSNAITFKNGTDIHEPWLLGYWLGNGNSSLNGITISSAEPEVYHEAEKIAKKYNLKINIFDNKLNSCCFYNFTSGRGGKWGRNKLLNVFKELGLDNNKHIPLIYKTSSISERKELLAGLIDSDGYVYKGACGASFVNKNKILVIDVAFICRSLGLAAYIKKRHDKQP